MEQEVQLCARADAGRGLCLDDVHGRPHPRWDLAKATGQDATLPSELVEASYALVLPRKGQMPAPAFGTEVEVSEDADTQTKLLGDAGARRRLGPLRASAYPLFPRALAFFTGVAGEG